PLGEPDVPGVARFEAAYKGVDLAEFSDLEQWRGVRLAGAASGHNVLEWPTGSFKEHRGEGQFTLSPPPGVELLAAATEGARDPDRSVGEWGPFGPSPLAAHLPIGGEMTYRFDPDTVRV